MPIYKYELVASIFLVDLVPDGRRLSMRSGQPGCVRETIVTAAREGLDGGRELAMVDDSGALLVLGIGTSSGLDCGL